MQTMFRTALAVCALAALADKGVRWAWYAGHWSAALADGRRPPDQKRSMIYATGTDRPIFRPHHQPFNDDSRFAPGTADRAEHIRDGDQLLRNAAAGQLPAVSFYKPPGRYTRHPSHTDLKSGDEPVAALLGSLRATPQ